MTDAARSAAEGFTGNLQSAQFVYPPEPVGLGAKWTAELEVATEGFAVPATYPYEVTDIADGRYTVAVAYDSTFDTTIEGQAATGTMTGGTVVGLVDNPLAMSVTVGQTIDATSGGVAVSVVVGDRRAGRGPMTDVTLPFRNNCCGCVATSERIDRGGSPAATK